MQRLIAHEALIDLMQQCEILLRRLFPVAVRIEQHDALALGRMCWTHNRIVEDYSILIAFTALTLT